jgi:alkylation response protein AidB-like acyl-CoA dehydrogenase
MPYRAPISEYAFVLTHVAGFGAVQSTARFEGCTNDLMTAILAEAGKLSEETLAPLNRVGDKIGSRIDNGAVTTPPGFSAAYKQIAEGGYVGMGGNPAFGGLGLPMALVVFAALSVAGWVVLRPAASGHRGGPHRARIDVSSSSGSMVHPLVTGSETRWSTQPSRARGERSAQWS